MAKKPKTTPMDLCRLTEDEARAYLESIRWPDGPVCAHCGSKDVTLLGGKATRPGTYKCRSCRKQFTVTVGTIFERSRLPLRQWVYVFARMCASKKGISAKQIERELGITYKSAWFMCHRVRHALDHGALGELLTGVVEADETYVGGRPRHSFARKTSRKGMSRGTEKVAVAAVVQRGGQVRAQAVPNASTRVLGAFLRENVHPSAALMTDDWKPYRSIGRDFASHQFVRHSMKEYARRGNPNVTTNTIEGFFGLVKRGIYGTFHHVSRRHLNRYLHEFSFRYNTREMTDVERIRAAIGTVEGKRLVYRKPKTETLKAASRLVW